MNGDCRKDRGLSAALLVTAIAALLLCFFLIRTIQTRRDRLADTEAALSESVTAWQTTAAEKEALQAELTEAQNSLREAQLTLDENTTRSEELTAENDGIRQELAALDDSLAAAQAENERLRAKNEALTALLGGAGEGVR